jgi:cytochrome c-type biogenesis protein CcmH|tara:strand:- start:96 stop:464 length:369 start_codon:yes stop_codon:yes gene_type:complete
MKKIRFVVLFLIVFQALYTISFSNENKINIDNISKNLRCLICQGQSIYDSQSEFALSMKKLIKNKISNGASEEEVYSFLKQKYGEWIVYDPEVNKNTILLWGIPLILFMFGGLLILRKVNIK